MEKNEHSLERVARVIVGLLLLSMIFTIESGWRYVGIIGILPLATGLTGVCPLYTALGVTTLKKKGGK